LWKHLSHVENLFGTETVLWDLDVYALDIYPLHSMALQSL
jgi:hypothetical protein